MFCFRININNFESVAMQKINPISFQGVKKSPPNKVETKKPNSSPTTSQIEFLPANNSGKAINPILPSDYINESDLKRYKKVQKEWARMFAEKTNIPYENIMARLPEIKPAKAEEIRTTLGWFRPKENVIEINPIKEMANLYGGDEGRIVHESTHALLHNLRRAYAKQTPRADLSRDAYIVVITKMVDGENKLIYRGEELKEVDGKLITVSKMMIPPQLSFTERQSLVNTIPHIKLEHIDTKTLTLNENGINLIKTRLLPQLDEYRSRITGTPEEVAEMGLEGIVKYINSFYNRKHLIFQDLTSDKKKDLQTNLETPLTEAEKNLAKKSFDEILSTKEGNMAVIEDKKGILDSSGKSYFMSYEEELARRYHNEYRLHKINKKLETIQAKGLNPNKKLLQEKQTIQNNLKILDLTRQLQTLERKIIHAPKDLNKLKEISLITKNIRKLSKNPEIANLKTYIKDLKLDFKNKTAEEAKTLIRNNLSPEKVKLYDLKLKIIRLMTKYNKLNQPEKILADTPENNILKENFYTILNEIRKISTNSDLSALPKIFFKSKKEYIKHTEKTKEIISKWMRRLK